MEEKIEQELKNQIRQILEIEEGRCRSRYHPERCREVAKRCEEILSRYPITSLPPDIYSTLRRYYLANKHKVILHNIIGSLLYSPEYRMIVLHSDSDDTQEFLDALDKYLIITNKCGEKIGRLEAKLKSFVNPSYQCTDDIDRDAF